MLDRAGLLFPPKSVTVVISEDTLVITLHGALSPAEQAMSASPAGAAKVQEFHRQLFATSSESLRDEIRRILGVEVREAAAEIDVKSGAVVHAFTKGTMVQVFLLDSRVPPDRWSGETLLPIIVGPGDPTTWSTMPLARKTHEPSAANEDCSRDSPQLPAFRP